PSRPRGERARPDEQDRRGELPEDVMQGELGGEPAREEAQRGEPRGTVDRPVGVPGEPRPPERRREKEPGNAHSSMLITSSVVGQAKRDAEACRSASAGAGPPCGRCAGPCRTPAARRPRRGGQRLA